MFLHVWVCTPWQIPTQGQDISDQNTVPAPQTFYFFLGASMEANWLLLLWWLSGRSELHPEMPTSRAAEHQPFLSSCFTGRAGVLQTKHFWQEKEHHISYSQNPFPIYNYFSALLYCDLCLGMGNTGVLWKTRQLAKFWIWLNVKAVTNWVMSCWDPFSLVSWDHLPGCWESGRASSF